MLRLARRLAPRFARLAARANPFALRYECPICGYQGPFLTVSPASGRRKAAQCPSCHAMERHRLQYLVLESLLKDLPVASMRLLHFAPEPFLQEYFAPRFAHYETADLFMPGVDYKVDLTDLPFPDESYDMVFASHVLEHIRDDTRALGEIRRILKPSEVAVLPVPLVAEHTVEYPEPNPNETNHVRAPGYADYFDRYRAVFSRVDLFASDRFPERHQLYVHEDRSRYPSAESPWRQPMQGDRHPDVVPVCYR